MAQGNDQETDLSKDKNPESGYDQVKSQVETLAKKLHIIEGSSVHGSVDLDSLTNFPQVIMPSKFKTPKFVKYDSTGDPCTHFCVFCRKMAPYKSMHHSQKGEEGTESSPSTISPSLIHTCGEHTSLSGVVEGHKATTITYLFNCFSCLLSLLK